MQDLENKIRKTHEKTGLTPTRPPLVQLHQVRGLSKPAPIFLVASALNLEHGLAKDSTPSVTVCLMASSCSSSTACDI